MIGYKTTERYDYVVAFSAHERRSERAARCTADAFLITINIFYMVI